MRRSTGASCSGGSARALAAARAALRQALLPAGPCRGRRPARAGGRPVRRRRRDPAQHRRLGRAETAWSRPSMPSCGRRRIICAATRRCAPARGARGRVTGRQGRARRRRSRSRRTASASWSTRWAGRRPAGTSTSARTAPSPPGSRSGEEVLDLYSYAGGFALHGRRRRRPCRCWGRPGRGGPGAGPRQRRAQGAGRALQLPPRRGLRRHRRAGRRQGALRPRHRRPAALREIEEGPSPGLQRLRQAGPRCGRCWSTEGGFLCIACCSHNVPMDAFREASGAGIKEAGRGGRLLARPAPGRTTRSTRPCPRVPTSSSWPTPSTERSSTIEVVVIAALISTSTFRRPVAACASFPIAESGAWTPTSQPRASPPKVSRTHRGRTAPTLCCRRSCRLIRASSSGRLRRGRGCALPWPCPRRCRSRLPRARGGARRPQLPGWSMPARRRLESGCRRPTSSSATSPARSGWCAPAPARPPRARVDPLEGRASAFTPRQAAQLASDPALAPRLGRPAGPGVRLLAAAPRPLADRPRLGGHQPAGAGHAHLHDDRLQQGHQARRAAHAGRAGHRHGEPASASSWCCARCAASSPARPARGSRR